MSPTLYLWPETRDVADLRAAQAVSLESYELLIPMAEGRDWLIRGNASIAKTWFDSAAAVFKVKWDATNDLNRNAIRSAFRKRRDEQYPFISPQDISGLSRLCYWHPMLYTGAGGNGIAQGACFYVVRFLIPAARAELLLQAGDHESALKMLFTIYHLSTLTSVSTLAALEAAYGTGTPAPMSYNPSTMGANTATQVKMANGTIETVGLHDSDIAAVQVRAASIYADWGDLYFRMGNNTLAKPKYMQVLRIYTYIWSQVVAGSSSITAAPEELRLVLRAHAQLTKMASSQNFLGYRDDHVPVWDYQFLRDAASYFVREAKGLERDALSFLSAAEDATQQEALLVHQAAIAKTALELERARVAVEQTSVTIAQQSRDLAKLRRDNMEDQIAEFESNHPIASATGFGAVVGFIQDPGSYLGDFGATVGEFGGYVGSVFGWSTSGSIQRAEKEEQYHQMQREQKELEAAVEIARTEVTRATQSLAVARIGEQIAQLELGQATAAAQFSANRIVNAELWYRLSQRLRHLSRRYLDHAITLSWLTEQAYEFDENELLNVVRFDYLSRNDWLAADQLLFDLDVIEYRRITSRTQKEVHVSHVISLQNKDLIELDRLRSNGELRFTTTESELDLAYPGTYNRRIERVEVDVVALAGPGGVRGRLTKGPISWLKFSASSTGGISTSNSFSDWLIHTPSPFRVRMIKGAPETMILSAREQAMGSSGPSNDGDGLKGAFERQPVSGVWLLQLPKSANDFDYGTIADVLIKIHFTAYFDEQLRNSVLVERRKLFALGASPLGSVTGFSMRLHFPDQLYDFFNPQGDPAISAKHRLLWLDLSRNALPPNQMTHRLTDFWLAAAGASGLFPLTMKVTSGALNPGKVLSVINSQLHVNGAPASLSSIRWFPDPARGESFEKLLDVSRTPALGPAGATLLDRWIIRVDASDNASLTDATSGEFDTTKLRSISDVLVQYAYRYELPGREGAPITMWAHFNEAPARYRTATGPATGNAWVGSGWNLNIGLGVFEYAGTAVQDMATSSSDRLFAKDFELSLDAALDPSAQFRLRLEGTGSVYAFRVGRGTSNDFTYEVVREVGTTTTVVKQGPFVPDGDGVRLRVSARQSGDGTILKWFAGTQEVAAYTSTTPHDLQVLKLRAQAARVRVDNVLVSDFTGRGSTPP